MNGPRTIDVRPVSVLVFGQLAAPEFAPVATELSSHDHVEVSIHESCADLSTHEVSPDLVVVLQRWSEEYSPPQIFKVLDEFPLSRLIVCCGPWCDSDGRTRSLWPLAGRVRAEFAAARLRHELAAIAESTAPLPITGNRDETYVFDHDTRFDGGATTPTDVPLSVAVVTPDPAIRDWLNDALESANLVVHPSPRTDADLILWDADPWTPENAAALNEQRQAVPTTPIIVLVGYNRPDVERQLRLAGATAVVAKLAPATQLLCVVADVIGRNKQYDRPPIHLATHQ